MVLPRLSFFDPARLGYRRAYPTRSVIGPGKFISARAFHPSCAKMVMRDIVLLSLHDT
jgi:hypothetical protein